MSASNMFLVMALKTKCKSTEVKDEQLKRVSKLLVKGQEHLRPKVKTHLTMKSQELPWKSLKRKKSEDMANKKSLEELSFLIFEMNKSTSGKSNSD